MDVSRIIGLYEAGIRYTDDVLRDLFQSLKELGFFERTFLVQHFDRQGDFADVVQHRRP